MPLCQAKEPIAGGLQTFEAGDSQLTIKYATLTAAKGGSCGKSGTVLRVIRKQVERRTETRALSSFQCNGMTQQAASERSIYSKIQFTQPNYFTKIVRFVKVRSLERTFRHKYLTDCFTKKGVCRGRCHHQFPHSQTDQG